MTIAMNRRQARLTKLAVISLDLVLFGIWTLTPLYWIVVTSIKPNLLIYREPALFPSQVTLEHYSFVLEKTPFLRYVKNSFLVTIATTAMSCVVGTLAAYAITRLQFKGREWVARSVVVTYLVPVSLLFIPMFQVIYSLGLMDNILGLMVTYLTFTIPFATWMMIGYFRNAPFELEDAALVDGCSRIQSLVLIMLPLALPALAVVALFSFTLSWNEFLYALVFIGSDSQKTLTLGLIGLVRGDTFPWGPMMAASLLGALPPVLVYIISQKWVKGWWDDKLIPPGSTTWDDTGNNSAYQAKQVAFVRNPPSIYAWMQTNDQELLKNSTMAAFPAGKGGSYSSSGAWSWSVFKASKNADGAKALLYHLMDPKRLQTVYEAVGGRWYPIYKNGPKHEYWMSREIYKFYPDLLAGGRGLWYPSSPEPKLMAALGETRTRNVIPDMVQDIVVKGTAVEQAVKTAHDAMTEIFKARGANV